MYIKCFERQKEIFVCYGCLTNSKLLLVRCWLCSQRSESTPLCIFWCSASLCSMVSPPLTVWSENKRPSLLSDEALSVPPLHVPCVLTVYCRKGYIFYTTVSPNSKLSFNEIAISLNQAQGEFEAARGKNKNIL